MITGSGFSRPGLRTVLGAMFVLMSAGSLFAQTNGVFDATTGYVTIPHDPALDVGAQLTLEAWVRPGPSLHTFGAIIDKDYTVGFAIGVENFHPVTDSVTLVVYIGYGRFAGPPIPANDDVWTHVAATVDTVAHQAFLYVNGALVNTFTGPLVRFADPPEDVIIGRSKYGDIFHGLVDEVRIWNVVRSQGEIAGYYAYEAKGNEPGLVAVYHFEDQRDTVAWNRAAGGGLHGTLSAWADIVDTWWGFDVTRPWTIAFTMEHEPNDSYANATPFSFGSRILMASVAPGDTDTYKIYMHPGDVLDGGTEAANPGEEVTLGMIMVGPDTATVFYEYETVFPSVDMAASVDGYRYFRVHAGSGPGGSYVLDPYLAEVFEVDMYEPNNSMAEATSMPWGSLATPTMFPGIDVGIAVPDTDYFSVMAEEGDIGLFLFSQQGGGTGNGKLIPFSPTGPQGNSFPSHVENVVYTSAGTYYARIHVYRTAIRYRLGLFKGLTDINGMLYDPATYGARVCLVAGWGDAYHQSYRLLVNDDQYDALPDYSIDEADGRQFVFLPAEMSGLNVSRKFFVPTAAQGDSLGYMRIQEILNNPTGEPITATVGVRSDLGDASKVGITGLSSGGSELSPLDTWAVTTHIAPPEHVPALTHIFDGIGGRDRVDSASLVQDILYWEWRDVTVPPGETRILMYYVAQDTVWDNALRKGPAFSGSALPGAAIVGLGDDGYNVLNWPTELLVGVDDAPAVPGIFSLGQNYPNPFNPSTTIRYSIPASAGAGTTAPGPHQGSSGSGLGTRGRGSPHEAGNVRLAIYDILGRQVKVLVDERKGPGDYEVTFDARSLASGIYLYRLTAGSFVDSKKMILMK